MKTKSIFTFMAFAAILWLACFSPFMPLVLAQQPGPEMDISEAVAQGLVDADVRASGDSYYGSGTLNATLTNTSEQPLTVVIPQGLRFRSQDTTYQDEIVAVTEQIPLQPGEIVETPLTSFCGNAHRAAPAADTPYTVGEMESPKLRNLLKEIESENLQDDIEGQWAVWGETDDMPIPSMPDFSDVLSFLDDMNSQGVGRQVAMTTPALDGALLQQLAWLALFKTLLPWLLLALGLLLLALLIWWLLSRRRPVSTVAAPAARSGSLPRKQVKKKSPKRTGASIQHGRPAPPAKKK